MASSSVKWSKKTVRSSAKLNDFLANSIQVPREDELRYNQAVDEIVRFLQASSPSFRWKIKRVFKSGSLDKGTGVKDNVDVDLYVFIERTETLTDPQSFLRYAPEIVLHIALKFALCFKWQDQGRNGSRTTPWRTAALGYTDEHGLPFIPLYKSHNDSLLVVTMVEIKEKLMQDYSLRLARERKSMVFDMDINVVFDLHDYLGIQDSRKIFTYIKELPNPSEFAEQFCPSLVELNFVGTRLNNFKEATNSNKRATNSNDNLKKLILLIKWWYKQEVKVKASIEFKSSLLELVCLHVWETKLKYLSFDLVVWLEVTMKAFIGYHSLDCVWTDFYDLSIVPSRLREEKPLILDPENPWRNMASKADWSKVQKHAENFIESFLLKKPKTKPKTKTKKPNAVLLKPDIFSPPKNPVLVSSLPGQWPWYSGCGRRFKTETGRNSHESVCAKSCRKRSQYLYLCYTCGRRFMNQRGRMQHGESKGHVSLAPGEPSPKPVPGKCPTCGKWFDQDWKAQDHRLNKVHLLLQVCYM